MIYEIFRIFGTVTGYPAQLLFFKRKTYYEGGKRRRAFKGGKLVISNHYNVLDYVMSCFVVFPRKLHAVTSEAPFKSKLVTFLMRFWGCIKCDRETRSMRFMDVAADVLKNGKLVQIFPEGHNTPDGKIHEFKHSYLVIAHRSGAPIVPVVTDGNYGVFKRTHVIIGKEIDVSPFFDPERRTPTREELKTANEYVYNKVLALREELENKKQRRTQ